MNQMRTAELTQEFEQRYGKQPQLFSAPGRVNLIGEHTDYNEGFVLPMAIERRTYVAGAPRDDRKVRVRSVNLQAEGTLDLDVPAAKRRGIWLDYIEGTARSLLQRGFALRGADLLIYSEVPSGAGLSASAALELAVGYALCRLSGHDAPDRLTLALAGQAAEHEHVGTRCGVMDQYIAALGEENAALLIDCRTLEPKLIPLNLNTACFLICDTGVKHDLATSAYNERRAECEGAVRLLSESEPGLRSLRDVTLELFAEQSRRLPEVVQRRCRHVLNENRRTLAAALALQDGLLVDFGQLMNESHQSLRDDYEVSCAELDHAVAVASAQPGVYGSRMTGGGFGGCTVTLVEVAAVDAVSRTLRASFGARFGRVPALFSSGAAQGVRKEG